MLLFEVRSKAIDSNFVESEILEGESNKYGFKAAYSLARDYSNNGYETAIIVHNKNNYIPSSYCILYMLPLNHSKKWGNAKYDANGFYYGDWRLGF